jgi:hypothetical protein
MDISIAANGQSELDRIGMKTKQFWPHPLVVLLGLMGSFRQQRAELTAMDAQSLARKTGSKESQWSTTSLVTDHFI